MSLRRRLTLLVAVLTIAVAADCVIGGFLVVAMRDARHEHAAIREASSVAANLETNLVGQAASIRAYFLDADARSFNDYSAARARATTITAELERLAPRSVGPVIERVTQAALTWRTSAINPLIATEQRGAFADVIRDYSTGNAVPLFKDVTTSLTDLKSGLVTAGRDARQHQHETLFHVAEFAVATVALGALAFALVQVIANRWLTHPINQMREALAPDAVDITPTSVHGPVEMRALAASIDSLRDALRSERIEARRTTALLGQQSDVLRTFRTRHVAVGQPVDWDVAAELVSAKDRVAADCFDVSVSRQNITVVLIDALVQGIDAACVCLQARELIMAGLQTDDSLTAGLEWTTRQLAHETEEFGIGAFVARIDCETREVAYVNSGRIKAFVCDGRDTICLPTDDTLGVRTEWTVRTHTLGPGQLFVCHTDGLASARTESHISFADEDLARVACSRFGESAEAVTKQLLIESGAADARNQDDVAIITICHNLQP